MDKYMLKDHKKICEHIRKHAIPLEDYYYKCSSTELMDKCCKLKNQHLDNIKLALNR